MNLFVLASVCFVPPSAVYQTVVMSSNGKRPLHIGVFSESKSAHPSFQPNVRTQPCADVLVDNSPYSRIYHLTVSNDQKPLYDVAALSEPTGAICVAFNQSGKIALLRQWRAVPASKPGTISFDKLDTSAHGFFSIEIPRGFPEAGETPAQAAAREAQEELGLKVERVRQLGWVNCNTAIFMTDIPMYAVLVGAERAGDVQDEAEHIVGFEWYDLDAVKKIVSSGEIRCSLTLSAISFLLARDGSLLDFVEAGGGGEGL